MDNSDGFKIIELQEDRLLRAEEKLGEVTTEISKLSVKQDFIFQTMDKNHSILLEKLSEGLGVLKLQNETMIGTFSIAERKADRIEDRIEPLEALHKQNKDRKQTQKKIIMAALLAASGVIGTKLVETSMHFFKFPW